MSIITFYSYKGGVGRSMAVANVALLLARQKRRVLVVDWDLEAPGVERYFADLKILPEGPGLLPLLRDVGRGARPEYQRYLWPLTALDGSFGLHLLHAGRETDPNYFELLEGFDWRKFFAAGGGDFLEELRERWLADFDFVLIDSRTGLSDSGGVCTIQLPDIVVALFTAARQSLFGVRDVMRLAQSARQRLAFDRPTLSVVPVPSRIDRSQPSYADWLRQFSENTGEFFSDWLPKDADRAGALDRLALEHASGALHGERAEVLAPDKSNVGLVTAYQRLAGVLASDLADISGIVQTQPKSTRTEHSNRMPEISRPSEHEDSRSFGDYRYDLYVSYHRSPITTRWITDHLLPLLTGYLELELARKPEMFVDHAELALGTDWTRQQRQALAQSRLLLGVWSPTYFTSAWCLAEFETFRARSKISGSPLIVPLAFHNGAAFPDKARELHYSDFTKYAITGEAFAKTELYLDFEKAVRDLALHVRRLIEAVPAFDPNWPIAEPKDLEPQRQLPSFKL